MKSLLPGRSGRCPRSTASVHPARRVSVCSLKDRCLCVFELKYGCGLQDGDQEPVSLPELGGGGQCGFECVFRLIQHSGRSNGKQEADVRQQPISISLLIQQLQSEWQLAV